MRFRVVVTEMYSQRVTEFVGSPADVCEQLLATYPWLRVHDGEIDSDLESIVDALDQRQAFAAFVETVPEQ